MKLPTTTTTRAQCAMSEIEFCAWVAQAEPGDRLEYYRGFLAHDTFSCATELTNKDRSELKKLACRTLRTFELGLVHLVQERLGVDRFAYIAIARTRQKSKATAASLSALLLNEAA